MYGALQAAGRVNKRLGKEGEQGCQRDTRDRLRFVGVIQAICHVGMSAIASGGSPRSASNSVPVPGWAGAGAHFETGQSSADHRCPQSTASESPPHLSTASSVLLSVGRPPSSSLRIPNHGSQRIPHRNHSSPLRPVFPRRSPQSPSFQPARRLPRSLPRPALPRLIPHHRYLPRPLPHPPPQTRLRIHSRFCRNSISQAAFPPGFAPQQLA